MKKDLKIKAIELRKEGYSINELQKILNVSKSTVSVWVGNVKLSIKAQSRLNNNYTKGQLASQKSIQIKTKQKNSDADAFALNVINNIHISDELSLLSCALLYQCEGSKSIKDAVTFTNSDPNLIKTFIWLFRKSFKLDEKKFRILMHLHEYHNEKVQKEFWSKITLVSISQFLKTYNKKNTGVYTKEDYQGCIQIRYRDVMIGRKLQSIAKTFMERYK